MPHVVVSQNSSVRVVSYANNGIINPGLSVDVHGPERAPAAQYLHSLLDVDVTLEEEGATLIYKASEDKYYVKKVDFGTVADIDGGIF